MKHIRQMPGLWRTLWVVFCKEWVDALRDKRTLAVVLLSSVVMGPVLLMALSGLLADFESSAEEREILVAGAQHAPSLVNYIERQTWQVKPAPPDYEAMLSTQRLSRPVLVIEPGFEEAVLRSEGPRVVLVSDSGNAKAGVALGAARRLLEGYSRERGALNLAMRGVSPELLKVVEVQDLDLANQQVRGAQLTGMLPFFVIMAVLYGALSAALDTTAGERERGSLEPLLMTPPSRLSLVTGKWLAVSAVGALVALLSCLSFLPSQLFLRSASLQALFQFGPAEAARFILALLPLAGGLSAVLLAVAIHSKTFKEAQANANVIVMGVSMLPLIIIFNPGAMATWYYFVPVLGQHAVLSQVLKGETVSWMHWLIPLCTSAALAVVGLSWVSRRLKQTA